MVIGECGSLAAKWEQISVLIGLRSDMIEQIRLHNQNQISLCWNEAMSEWIIKQNYTFEKFGKPSWRTLLKAVVQVNRRLFEELARKHKSQGA